MQGREEPSLVFNEIDGFFRRRTPTTAYTNQNDAAGISSSIAPLLTALV